MGLTLKKGILFFGLFSVLHSSFACDFPAFAEGVDRNYQVGDIISRDGKDYRVTVAAWANQGTADAYYAPGTGSAWTSCWALENNPCQDSGGNSGSEGNESTSSIWDVNGTNVSLSNSYSNVGIGTITPSSTLEIHGLTKIKAAETLGKDVLQLYYPNMVNGRNHYLFFSNRFYNNSTIMYSAIGAYSQAPNSTGNDEGPQSLIIQPQILGGNLGIGYHNAQPSTKLSVIGNTYISQNAGIGALPHTDVQLRVKGAKTVGFCVEHDYNSDWGYGIKTIVSNENTKAIGVINKLDDKSVFTVMGDGTIYGTEIQIKLRGEFPDYVFKEDYKLMSIDSLESYIENSKHLPNVPSADELKGEIALGEMTRIQQEKIEELTLYIIELKKRIDALESK